MNHTKNYGLPQWELNDLIKMEDFNGAMASLENGLTGNKAEAAAGVEEAKSIANSAKVTANDQYSLAALDTLTFVPNEDFVGTVNIRYFGYNVSGSRYAGELVVKVEQGLDDSIVYHDNGSGRVTFQAYDFTSFCRNATGGDFAYVSFTPPPASQGTLTHYGWPLTVYSAGALAQAEGSLPRRPLWPR